MGDDPLVRAVALHNLARRLGENGQASEGFAASSQAVSLLSSVFITRSDKISPMAMAGFLQTLVLRGEESGTEITFDANVVAAIEKMLELLGCEIGADLFSPVNVTGGLFDSAMRQGDTAAAQRLVNAVCRLAKVRPDDDAIQVARGMLASRLLWEALQSGARDRAREWLAEVAASARNAPNREALTVELGKCAADLITAYWQAGDIGTAARLAKELQPTLLSDAYLAARERDLGKDQADYFNAIIELSTGTGGVRVNAQASRWVLSRRGRRSRRGGR
jgi:hypothetical protein